MKKLKYILAILLTFIICGAYSQATIHGDLGYAPPTTLIDHNYIEVGNKFHFKAYCLINENTDFAAEPLGDRIRTDAIYGIGLSFDVMVLFTAEVPEGKTYAAFGVKYGFYSPDKYFFKKIPQDIPNEDRIAPFMYNGVMVRGAILRDVAGDDLMTEIRVKSSNSAVIYRDVDVFIEFEEPYSMINPNPDYSYEEEEDYIPPSITGVPSKGNNYIKTTTLTSETGSQFLDQVQYFDGLGRLTEAVQVGITPNQQDLVTIQEYDGFGREYRSWLSALSSSRGQFMPHSTAKVASRTLNLNDASPYNEIVYENSPLSRPVEQYGPGAVWHNNKKAVKVKYLTNSAEMSCALYTANNYSLTKVGDYGAGELYVTEVTDEDGNIAYEFKNKLGQVVLTRQINTDGNNDTHYVYDDYGNLCFVLPPLAADALTNNTSWTEEDTNPAIVLYAYIYKYDNRNRCVAKKLPGAEWIYYMYDNANRLIFTQDGKSRARDECVFTIPDAMGRIVLTGTDYMPHSPGFQWIASALENTLVTATWTNTTNHYNGYNVTGVTFANSTILSVNYYDDHSFIGLNGVPTDINYIAKTGYGTMHGSSKGLPTGTSVASLNSPGIMYHTAMFYDYKGNMIQAKSTNHLNGYDNEYTAYNFMGQPTSKILEHATNSAQSTELYTYIYDHAGRLLETKHKLDAGAEISLAKNEYDDLGRLNKTTRNNNAELATTRAYNIRSQVTQTSEHHFIENLSYTYGGNINSMQWGQASVWRTYNFTYDNKSQLLTANYTSTIGTDNQNTAYSYDKHGNFKTIERYGKISAGNYGIVDKLTMEYNGNQLRRTTDAAANVSIAESDDFKDYYNAAVEYTYNNNGAMTQDLNKGISDIQYNLLNLPKQMDVKNPLGESRREYTYSAGGQKLKVIERWNPNFQTVPQIGSGVTPSSLTSSLTTDYVANKIYENGSLKRTLIPGGYIEAGQYYFFLTDHLGSTHLLADKEAMEHQQVNYYPFGMAFADGVAQDVQPYKFTGKELDNKHKIGIYDSKARMQDTQIPRFLSIDPLAEDYYSWSPYVYVKNNPLRYIDLRGDSVTLAGTEADAAFTELQSSVSSELTLTNTNGVITYSLVGTSPLSANAQQLADAINSTTIKVNIIAENTKTTSLGHIYIGGAFMGNQVVTIEGINIVSARQEINPTVLSTADKYNGTPGSLTLHEVTEAYQGALISQRTGVSANAATQADFLNPNGVFRRAHDAATPQNFRINETAFNSEGKILSPPYKGAVRAEYSISMPGKLPLVILTLP